MSEQAIQIPAGLTTNGLLGKRYFARVIDSTIGAALLLAAFTLLNAVLPKSTSRLEAAVLTVAISFIVVIGYGTLLEASPWQATIGKRLMGIRVYGPDGGRPSFLQAAGRNVIKDGPFIAFTVITNVANVQYLLSTLWLAIHMVVLHRSAIYQAIHDVAAQTLVAAPEETIQLRLS
jgi:uncharacterized RDD family membrane protein YckC